MITYEAIRENERIRAYITEADKTLQALGYTEHSFAHVAHVAKQAGSLLDALGYPARVGELARIAGFLHDIGNLVNREAHSQSGALMAFRILDNLGMEAVELSQVVSAIGNHDEGTGQPINPLSAALILADKSDVRRSRVRNSDPATFDIHDRVNYSVTSSTLSLSPDRESILLDLEVDTAISPVMEYFEIFLGRMLLCRKAASHLGCHFRLQINGQSLL